MKLHDHGLATDDLQGLLRGYSSPWPHALFAYLKIDPDRSDDAAAFLNGLDLTSTWAVSNGAAPDLCVNVAFTFDGLHALEVASVFLDTFPAAFRHGMRARAHLLGDVGNSGPAHWEDVWRVGRIDVLLMLYGPSRAALHAQLDAWNPEAHGLTVLDTQTGSKRLYDPADPVGIGDHAREPRKGDVIEHFGFRDGVSNPPIAGLHPQDASPGAGKYTRTGWEALSPGEFILGHLDEAGEVSSAPRPRDLARNGSFLVYRKLSQDVDLFRETMQQIAQANGVDPDYVATKMVGRNRDGTILGGAPMRGFHASTAFPDTKVNNDLRYADDPRGSRTPLGSHIRRTNPRDALGFATVQVSRHRLLRRGITYDEPSATQQREPQEAHSERGLIFIALNADLVRQFEFVQRQWVNFGNDLDQGDLVDPITGSTSENRNSAFVIPPGKDDGYDEPKAVLCANFQDFVHNKGGDYFFLPGIRAFRAITRGDYARAD